MEPNVPAVADVLTLDDRVYIVFNLAVLDNYTRTAHEWQTAEWTVGFGHTHHRAPINATSFGIMQGPNNHIIHAPLPPLDTRLDPNRALHVNITARLPQRTHTYINVPFCLQLHRNQEAAPQHHLAACIKCVPSEPWMHMLPEWVAYHVLQGVEHVYLYSLGPPRRMHALLAPFVRAGLVTIVDWEWQDEWVRNYGFSETHQNACLLRARGVDEWVAFADVDEFWQPRQRAEDDTLLTVAQMLQLPDIHNESALSGNTWYFGPSNNTLQSNADAANLTMTRWTARSEDAVRHGREKNIVRPETVTYMATHLVATGPPEYRLDPVHQMRVVHYKSEFAFADVDDSMSRQAHAVLSLLRALGYGDGRTQPMAP